MLPVLNVCYRIETFFMDSSTLIVVFDRHRLELKFQLSYKDDPRRCVHVTIQVTNSRLTSLIYEQFPQKRVTALPRWSHRVLPIIALLGVSGSFDTAHADQVLVSSLLADGVVSSNPISPSIIDSSDSWRREFTSGVSTNLVSIKASLGQLDPGNNGDFSLTAQLIQVSSASDNPAVGVLVATLSQDRLDFNEGGFPEH